MKKLFYLVSFMNHDTQERYTKIRISTSRRATGLLINNPNYLITSVGRAYHSLEELYKEEQLTFCKECGQIHSRNYNSLREDTCIICSIWLDMIDKNNDKTIITQDYNRYQIGEEDSISHFRGFGGRKFIITKTDGSIITSSNLWYQGVFPIRFRHLVTPNTISINN